MGLVLLYQLALQYYSNVIWYTTIPAVCALNDDRGVHGQSLFGWLICRRNWAFRGLYREAGAVPCTLRFSEATKFGDIGCQPWIRKRVPRQIRMAHHGPPVRERTGCIVVRDLSSFWGGHGAWQKYSMPAESSLASALQSNFIGSRIQDHIQVMISPTPCFELRV